MQRRRSREARLLRAKCTQKKRNAFFSKFRVPHTRAFRQLPFLLFFILMNFFTERQKNKKGKRTMMMFAKEAREIAKN